nr:uncharacterized protein LOC117862420 [Setaria viridis]
MQYVSSTTYRVRIIALEFAIGQALGGHMRRHRAAEADGGSNNGLGLGLSLGSGLRQKDGGRKVMPAAKVVLTKCMECSERGRKVPGVMGREPIGDSAGKAQEPTTDEDNSRRVATDALKPEHCPFPIHDPIG